MVQAPAQQDMEMVCLLAFGWDERGSRGFPRMVEGTPGLLIGCWCRRCVTSLGMPSDRWLFPWESLLAKTKLWKSLQPEVWRNVWVWMISLLLSLWALRSAIREKKPKFCKQRATSRIACPVFSRLISVPPTRCSSNQIVPVMWSPAPHGFFSVHTLSNTQIIMWRNTSRSLVKPVNQHPPYWESQLKMTN